MDPSAWSVRQLEGFTGVRGVGLVLATVVGLVFGFLLGFVCFCLFALYDVGLAAGFSFLIWSLTVAACLVLLRARSWTVRFDQDAVTLVSGARPRRISYSQVRFIDAGSRGPTFKGDQPDVVRIRIRLDRSPPLRIAFDRATAEGFVLALQSRCPATPAVRVDDSDHCGDAGGQRVLARYWLLRALWSLSVGGVWAILIATAVGVTLFDSTTSAEKLRRTGQLILVLTAVPFARRTIAYGLDARRRWRALAV